MDPTTIVMVSSMLAKELIHYIDVKRNMTEEQLAGMIAANMLKMKSISEVIKSEMEKYGVKI